MKTIAKTITLAFAALLAGCASIRTGGNPDGFVMLTEAVPDAILEPRYYSTYNFISDLLVVDRSLRPASGGGNSAKETLCEIKCSPDNLRNFSAHLFRGWFCG